LLAPTQAGFRELWRAGILRRPPQVDDRFACDERVESNRTALEYGIDCLLIKKRQ
jgi:hypothetical protein